MDRRIRKEKFVSRMIRSPFTYFVLFLLIILFSASAISTYKKSRIAKEKTRQVENELRILLEQEENLKKSLTDMNTSFGMEKALREKFGIVKDGEVSVIIVDPKEDELIEYEEKKQGIFGFIREIF